MDFLSVFAIGSALAADATAVSVLCGASDKSRNLRFAFFSSAVFGIFQMLMPILGWSIGKVGKNAVGNFDVLIAFLILLFLGGKMIFDALLKKDDYCKNPSLSVFGTLMAMAFATSIDALASGIVLPSAVNAVTPLQMLLAVLLIGTITFLFSLAGYFSGNCVRKLNPKLMQIIGGTILILIGIKTLLGL